MKATVHALAVMVMAGVLAACGDPAATPTLTGSPQAPATGSPTTTPAPTGTSPTPTPDPDATGIILTDHGLEPTVDLGASFDDAVLALQAAFGAPDDDSDWIEDHQTPFGACPGEATRGIRWGGLTALFFRNAPEPGPGEWLVSLQLSSLESPDDLGIRTPRGTAIGHDRAEIEAAYGADAQFDDGEPFWGGVVRLTDAGEELWGSLTGLDATDTLETLQAGDGCGE